MHSNKYVHLKIHQSLLPTTHHTLVFVCTSNIQHTHTHYNVHIECARRATTLMNKFLLDFMNYGHVLIVCLFPLLLFRVDVAVEFVK